MLSIFSLVFLSISWASESDWYLHSSRGGVNVYRSYKDHESGIVPIKANTVLDHSIEKILSVISSSSAKTNWVPYLKEAYVIEQRDIYSRIEYASYNSPWPLDKREFVLETFSRWVPHEKQVVIDIISVNNKKAPPKKEYIRGITYEGYVKLRPVNKNKTHFEIYFLTDFKGDIPKWIINMVQKKWPYKMFRSLGKRLDNIGDDYDKNFLKKYKSKPSPKTPSIFSKSLQSS